MLLDYHIHTCLCKHAAGVPEDYVVQAKKIGLGEIGISDHMPMPPVYDPENRMEEWQFPKYIEMVKEAQEGSGSMPVRFGIEGDYVREHVDYVREFLDKYHFDYVHGSVHFIGNWGFDNPKNIEEFHRRSWEEVYEEYFSLVIQAAQSRLFDIITHFDLVKKFGFKPKGGYMDAARKALEAIKDNDMVMEINTSGFRKPVKEAYPGPEIVAAAGEMDIPITLGSDSHDPCDVGRDFDRILPWLKEAGYTHICKFENRQRFAVPIES